MPQLWRLLPYAPLSADEVGRARSAFDEVLSMLLEMKATGAVKFMLLQSVAKLL